MKILHLYIYPVKSLRGCSVTTAVLTAQGLKYDRKYMLVRAKEEDDGTTAYESLYIGHVDALCLFTTSLLPNDEVPEKIRVVYNPPASNPERDEGGLGGLFIDIPIAADYASLATVDLNLHQSRCIGYDMGEEFEAFFTNHLGFKTKLIYVGDSTREILGNVAPNKTHITRESAEAAQRGPRWSIHGLITGVSGYASGYIWGKQVDNDEEYKLHFSDCAPLLITSQVSLEELNKGKKARDQELSLDMTKTRPNIVLSPSEPGEMTPFEEDYWAELSIRNGRLEDPLQIALTANCGRCKSLNVDYKTGRQLPVAEQMLKRLADMKRRVDPGMGYSPIFGRYGFVDKVSLGQEIEVGSEVEVVKKNEERTVFYWPGLSPGTRPKK
ncbi:hypothetical protein ABW19_dt0200071 [Dactylella cylindrospora]|nr:hypothetical protein ABW19_dt0200071 [Dactylella cylindrospora]